MLLAPIMILSIIYWGYKEEQKVKREKCRQRILQKARLVAEKERACIYQMEVA